MFWKGEEQKRAFEEWLRKHDEEQERNH